MQNVLGRAVVQVEERLDPVMGRSAVLFVDPEVYISKLSINYQVLLSACEWKNAVV